MLREVRGDVSSWVLSRFKDHEFPGLEKILTGSAEAIELVLNQGYERAANAYSRKNLLE